MKKTLALAAVVLTLGLTVAVDADAKRLGGGRSAGLQRPNVTAPAATRNVPPTPGQAATPGQTAPVAGAAAAAPGTAAAAAAPRSRWMAPLAGLAAGLGIAALASHFGFGEVLANLLTAGLVAMAVLLVIGFVLRKRAQSQAPALAGAGAGSRPAPFMAREGAGGGLIGTGLGAGAAATTAAGGIPAGFDAAAFERNAKEQFLGLQAANDAGDLARLRDYLTPEMFEVAQQEVRARGDAPQRTEVFGLQAQVLDVSEEGGRYVVSVRFTGSVRDQSGAVPEDLDETWHLAKPVHGSGGWVVAGIQQGERTPDVGAQR